MVITILLIIIAVLLFCFMILFHEFGHFFTAKLCGIRVNEFAFGMGPRLLHFKKGETTYSWRLLPIGGFCAMEGENGESSDERAFVNKPVWKRMIVIVSGGLMNILLGLVLMFIVVVQQPMYTTTQIAEFTEDALTPSYGLQKDDQFYSIDGYRTFTARDVTFALTLADPNRMDITVIRDGEKVKLEQVAMKSSEMDGRLFPVVDFRVYPEARTFGTVMSHTFSNTVSYTRMVWASLGAIITGKVSITNLSGPVGTASAITQVASAGAGASFMTRLNNIFLLMVIITINLGVINLLPLPALDGGRFLFLVIEAIRRKPINRKYEGWIHAGGLIALLLFMAFITVQDVLRLIH